MRSLKPLQEHPRRVSRCICAAIGEEQSAAPFRKTAKQKLSKNQKARPSLSRAEPFGVPFSFPAHKPHILPGSGSPAFPPDGRRFCWPRPSWGKAPVPDIPASAGPRRPAPSLDDAYLFASRSRSQCHWGRKNNWTRPPAVPRLAEPQSPVPFGQSPPKFRNC